MIEQEENAVAVIEAAAQAPVVKTPVERAVVALDSPKREQELVALVAKSADIVEVKNVDGRTQVHRMAMDLKNARCAITNTSEDARADATAFSRAVLAEERRLIALTTAEETRLFKLRDDFDTEQKRIEDERKEKEKARIAGIRLAIENIRMLPVQSFRDTSVQILETARTMAAIDISVETFGEFVTEATAVRHDAAMALGELIIKAEAAEAEAERVRLEGIELARQKEILAENARIEAARVAKEAEEARIAAAEQARIAAETQRQLDAQAAALEETRKEQARADELREAKQRQQAAAMEAIAKMQDAGNAQGDTRLLIQLREELRSMRIGEDRFGDLTSMSNMAHALAVATLAQTIRAQLDVEIPAAYDKALEENARLDAEREAQAAALAPIVINPSAPSHRAVEMGVGLPPMHLPLPESLTAADADAAIDAAPLVDPADLTLPLSVEYDEIADVLTVEGVGYAGAMFRDLAPGYYKGQQFEFVTDSNGVFSIKPLALAGKD